MSEIDFNKLVKDIIGAASGEAAVDSSRVNPLDENNKLIITLKLEVIVANDPQRTYWDNQKRSRKLVLLTIDGLE